MPASAAEAVKEYYDAWAELGIQAWEGPWWQSVLDFQHSVEALLEAPRGSVAPMLNVTRAMAAVASCFDYSGPRNKVVITDLEFTTHYPFWRGQELAGARIEMVESEDRVTVPTQKILDAIDETTLLVPTCHAYFRSGAVQDLRAVVGRAHEVGALVLGDGYQTVGTYPVDVKKLDVDFYVGGSHKYLCGGPGAGFLYVRPDLIPKLRPRLTGWFGLADPFGYVRDTGGAKLNEGVFKFLDGTPNVPALYAAREGIKAVRRRGIPEIRKNSLRLTKRVMSRADELGLNVRTPRTDAERSGMVCLEFEGSQEASRRLVKQGIACDWRPECGLRVSPHFYNVDEDVETLFTALEWIRSRTGPGPSKKETVPTKLIRRG